MCEQLITCDVICKICFYMEILYPCFLLLWHCHEMASATVGHTLIEESNLHFTNSHKTDLSQLFSSRTWCKVQFLYFLVNLPVYMFILLLTKMPDSNGDVLL